MFKSSQILRFDVSQRMHVVVSHIVGHRGQHIEAIMFPNFDVDVITFIGENH